MLAATPEIEVKRLPIAAVYPKTKTMNTKITTLAQIAHLRTGDKISRYPTNGAPQQVFDAGRPKDISAFTVQNINADTGILSLITAFDTHRVLIKAGETARLFITPADVIAENTWWVVTGDMASNK